MDDAKELWDRYYLVKDTDESLAQEAWEKLCDYYFEGA